MCLIPLGQRLLDIQVTVTRGHFMCRIYVTIGVLELSSGGCTLWGTGLADTRTLASVRAVGTDSTHLASHGKGHSCAWEPQCSAVLEMAS